MASTNQKKTNWANNLHKRLIDALNKEVRLISAKKEANKGIYK